MNLRVEERTDNGNALQDYLSALQAQILAGRYRQRSLQFTLIACEDCERPLYLIWDGQQHRSARVISLSRLAEAGVVPVFLRTSRAVFRLWPTSAVLSHAEYAELRDVLRDDHKCPDTA